MTIRIDNEWGALQRVIVGDGHEMGPPTTVDTAFDPTSYSHLKAGTYPDPTGWPSSWPTSSTSSLMRGSRS